MPHRLPSPRSLRPESPRKRPHREPPSAPRPPGGRRIGASARWRSYGTTSVSVTTRIARLAAMFVVLGGFLGQSACGRGGADGAAAPVLGWYVNPDNGGQAELAAACSAASGGRYRIEVSTLPNDASGQREQ